jgi:pyruvate,water dikinase
MIMTGSVSRHGSLPHRSLLISPATCRQKGEIMVARFTDIGWTPYYSIVNGLVTEIGSSLSHGAVVAREYGLPTVVNVKGATKLLKNGDHIVLNASKGTIRIV